MATLLEHHINYLLSKLASTREEGVLIDWSVWREGLKNGSIKLKPVILGLRTDSVLRKSFEKA